MNMYKKILGAVLFMFLSACVSSGTGKISNIDSVKIAMKKEESIDKEKVVALYGKPNSEYKKDGKDVFEYKYISIKNNALGYVPILGMWFNRTYKANYLYTYFDKNGNLVDFDTVSISGKY